MSETTLLACYHCAVAFPAPEDFDTAEVPLCKRCSGQLDVEEHELPQD